jgi:hypothetical protein
VAGAVLSRQARGRPSAWVSGFRSPGGDARSDISAFVAAAFPSTEWHTFFSRVAEFCSPGLTETIETAMSRVRPPSRRGENSRLLKKPPRPPKPRQQPAVDAWTAYHLRKGHLVIRPQGDCQFDYRHVPQHLPLAWIDARFSDVPARHLRYLNTVAAIRLAQMSSGGSHATAGEQLGVPSGTVSHAVHHVRVWTQLTEWIIPHDDWEQVSAQIAATPGLKQAGRASQRRRTPLLGPRLDGSHQRRAGPGAPRPGHGPQGQPATPGHRTGPIPRTGPA